MLTNTKKSKKFRARPLHRKKEPHAFHYLSQRTTFWIAVFSLLAFVTGNMVGQHGWTVFWKSVLGGTDDSLIVYAGTVSPVSKVPDYAKWAQYGGSAQLHTYSEVPLDALRTLPFYDSARQSTNPDQAVYSVGYMGSYDTGKEGTGSHPAVDIRMPVGTPVQAVMNGIITTVGEDAGGFGSYIVIRHPNVPDPAKPTSLVTLYSSYAHLSREDVTEGQIVSKGQQIGLSGQTGYATGPHLHFQIDRDVSTDGVKVAYHPFWPFTSAEARAAGMTYTEALNQGLNQDRGYRSTVNPLVYLQAQYAPVVVAQKSSVSSRQRLTAAELREQRIKARVARSGTTVAAVTRSASSAASSSAAVISQTQVVAISDVSSTTSTVRQATTYATVEILTARSFTGRQWETVKVRLLDADGRPVTNPSLGQGLYMRTAFGKAEFRPAVLSELDFENGEATVQMLPLGRQTVVVQVQPGNVVGAPMKYVGD